MSERGRMGGNRRAFLTSTGVAATVGLAGCIGDFLGTGDDDDITFVLNPAESDVDIVDQYQPMFDYLEAETGATFDVDATGTYTETLAAIRDGHAELADTSPSAAVAGSDVADVVGIRIQHGAELYFSTISTTPDSDIESLEDLEGEEVYASGTMSVSGTLVPLTMLADAGLETGGAPDGEPEDFDIEYDDHSTARNQMIERDEVSAALTGAFTSAPLVPQEQFDEMSDDFVEISAEYDGAGSDIGAEDADPNDELQLLAVSDPLPRAPIMARSDWDDDIREDIEEALLNVEEEDLTHDDDYDGEELWFTGVEEGSIDDYEPIQEVMDTLDLEFEDLE